MQTREPGGSLGTILAEEAAEVIEVLSRIIRIKSKAVRFGIDDFHPKNGAVNRISLEEEIGHFSAMVDILIKRGVLTELGINSAHDAKLKKLGDWSNFKG